MQAFKNKISQTFPRTSRYLLILIKGLLLKTNSYLHTTGWMRTIKTGEITDQTGKPIPWMNYQVVTFLDERLNKKLSLFECGSGYSTSFYAERVANVHSLEHDKKWYHTVQELVPINVQMVFQDLDENGEYCRAIKNTGKKFDVVIVDGRDRVNCLKQAIETLTEQGVIVLDDSHRERYQEGIDYAKTNGFKALQLSGMKPLSPQISSTTILYKNSNCLGL